MNARKDSWGFHFGMASQCFFRFDFLVTLSLPDCGRSGTKTGHVGAGDLTARILLQPLHVFGICTILFWYGKAVACQFCFLLWHRHCQSVADLSTR
jgi:hypothetical protein